jgi:hypothetical protein
MNLLDLFEGLKPSDIPTAMRKTRLTMKDIEAERPQGVFRFRVGDKQFMDRGAAEEFAQGTGQKVEPMVQEDEHKKSTPRIDRILKQLRIRHPQAKDDLEALIYSFQDGQKADRRDINRLDQENDAEEADIEQLEQMIQALKKQREDSAAIAEQNGKKSVGAKIRRSGPNEDPMA